MDNKEAPMQFFRSRLFLLASILALVIFSAAFVACGDDDDDDDDGGATTAPAATTPASVATTPADGGGRSIGSLSGEINIDGSSTVYPISAAMAEEFNGVASDVQVNVAFSGTGGGFELFCNGEIEVSDASRPIKDSADAAAPGEVQKCAANGIEDIVQLQVGIDALTVMVTANDFVTCLTVSNSISLRGCC
jgi:ABC-type phosphate transport system substrate-binding protein